jgi:GT2 family glycosyltransferase
VAQTVDPAKLKPIEFGLAATMTNLPNLNPRLQAGGRFDDGDSVKISVVIPTVRAGTIEQAVESIRRQSHSNLELIVVAQGGDPSLAQAVERIRKSDDRFIVECLTEKGVSVARNRGIERAQSDVVAIIDDDCEADVNWLATIATIFDADPDIQLVGGQLVAPPPLQRFGRCPSVSPAEILYQPSEHSYHAPPGFEMLTANMAFRKVAWEKVGGFDELLGPGTAFGAGEDPDFVLRIEAANLTMRSTGRAIVTHTNGYRYGLRAQHTMLKGYARGQGALAAKLALGGDKRGSRRLKSFLRAAHTPKNILRAYYFGVAYIVCTLDYEVDANGHLSRKSQPPFSSIRRLRTKR